MMIFYKNMKQMKNNKQQTIPSPSLDSSELDESNNPNRGSQRWQSQPGTVAENKQLDNKK
jgi:hypothetical protein